MSILNKLSNEDRKDTYAYAIAILIAIPLVLFTFWVFHKLGPSITWQQIWELIK